MIKILHIFAGLKYGGVESFVLSMQEALAEDNVQFDFLLRENNNDPKKIKYFKNHGSKIFITSPWPKKILKNYIQTRDFFSEHGNEYDYIHIHANSLLYTLPIILAEKYRANIIVHSHNTSSKKNWMKIIHFMNRFILSKKNIIRLACSDMAGKWMFGDNYIVVPNGLNVERYKISKEELEAKERKTLILLSVGRIEKQKNYMFMLPVIKRLKDKGVKLKYFIAGDGILREKLQKKIQNYGLSDCIELLGNVAHIEKLLKKAHIFVMPSLYEGFSIAHLEAQCNGIACIISNKIPAESMLCKNVFSVPLNVNRWVSKIEELWAEEKTGFLYENYKMIAESAYSLEGLGKNMRSVYRSN